MDKTKKRAVAILVIAIMVLLALAGCGTSQQSGDGTTKGDASNAPVASSGEKLKVRYVIPGNVSTGMPDIVAAVNEKLQQDGLNLEFSVNNIAWDAWDQKTNLMISTGEEFEMMEVAEDVTPLSSYVGRNATKQLDEYIDQYGAEIKKNIPDFLWDCVSFKGKINAVPAPWLELASAIEWIAVRTDLFEKHNVSLPKTPEELLSACETIAANEKELNPKVWTKVGAGDSAEFLHRSYSTWPFTVIWEIAYIDQSGNVKPWIETEEFKKDAEFWRTLYEKGLIDPDILTVPPDIHNKNLDEGKFLFEHSMALFQWQNLRQNLPDAKMQLILLNPDKPKFNNIGVRNMNIVPSTCTHPEAPVQFLNWLYTSQDNYDLFMYGIKDKHWKITEGSKLKWNGIEADTIDKIFDAETKVPIYEGPEWMIGLTKYKRWTSSDHPQWLEIYQPQNDAISSVALGFKFDTANVTTEYANVLAEMSTSINPIKYGVVDYDTHFAAALDKMKAAGLDRVIEEFDRQFKEFMASKK